MRVLLQRKRRSEVYQGCVQLTETFAVTRKRKANFSLCCDRFLVEGSENHKTNLKRSFGTAKMTAYANKIYIFLFVTKNMGKFTVDIYNLFDLTLSLV